MSTSSIGVWSLELNPGKPHKFQPPADIHLTNVALGEKLVDASGRSVIKLSHPLITDDEPEDEEDVPTLLTQCILCSLIPGKIEQSTLNLILDEQAQYTLEVTGKNTVHLLGNYVDQRPMGPMGGMDDDSDIDSEDAYNLEDVSSDVEMEMDLAELDDDAEDEPLKGADQEQPKAGSKRAHETAESPKASKAEKKKSKKLKAADGSAAPAPASETKVPKDKTKEPKEKDTSGKDKDKKKKKEQGGAVTLSSGLKYTDAKVGAGVKAKKGDTVQMRYIGKLANGKIFDQNTKGKPFTFNLGKGEVIKGWDEGVAGMAAGGERTLVVPPNLGYGKRATDGIPSNSELHFEVKMVQIK